MIVFDSTGGAQAAAERMRSLAPDGVTVDSIEVREVVASA